MILVAIAVLGVFTGIALRKRKDAKELALHEDKKGRKIVFGGIIVKKYGVNDLRRMYLEFFESKGHLAMKSFSLVPHNDNSLLLINAGMAPLKPYFTGQEIPPRRRVTTCQKCIRTGDIENVGKTARHLTFFEMLGNFSLVIISNMKQLHGHGNS